MVKKYTEIFKNYQIRDVQYLIMDETSSKDPPKDKPIEFDVVKWYDHKPIEIIDGETGEKKISTRSCYSVGRLVYNPKEPYIDFQSVGLRWLEEHPDEDVENWLIKWCEYKLVELYCNEVEDNES